MADTKQTVEIAFKVVGIDLKKIDDLAKAFKGIEKSVTQTTKSLDKFQKTLKKIKTPPTFTRLATSLQKLEKIKLPNIDSIAKSLNLLSKISTPKALPTIATSLRQLSDVKLPPILNLAKGLDLLVKTKFSGFGMKITSVVQALKQFKGISVPNILQLAKGLKILLSTPFSGFNMKITTVVQGLARLKGMTLPNVRNMSAGLKELVELDIKALSKKIIGLNNALAQLKKRGSLQSFAKFAKDLRVVQGALAKAGISAKKASTSFKAVGDAAHTSGLKLRSFSDKVRTVMEFRLISEGLLQLKAAILGGVQAIILYDQALKDLQAITGATDREVAQMGVTILDVASKTKFSAAEVAEGMRVIGQAGFTATESVQTMQAVSDLATGTLSTMSTTVDLVTTAMRVFNIDASRSTEVVDVFANAVNRSKLTIDKLRTAMNFVGPIAKESGVTFQELSAAMGTLANSGIRASTIGTGLRRVFAELVDPSKKLKAAADAVGISLRDLSPESSSLSDVLANLRLVIKDTGTAFDIFGKRGAASVLALTSSTSQFDNMLDLVSRSGTAAEQAAKQMEGLGISFKNLKDKLGVLAIELGKGGIADGLKIVADAARFVVDGFILLAGTPIGGLVVKAGVLVGAMAALSATLLGLEIIAGTAVFVALQAAFVSLTGVVITATVSLNGFLLSLGPIGAALALIGVIMYTVNSSLQQTAGELLTTASEFENLSKQVTDYYIGIIGLTDGSSELETKTIALRDQLLKVANGYGAAAGAAAEAAASISPLTKNITDNGEALQKYSDVLQKLQFDTLFKAAEVANQSFTQSMSAYASGIRILKESFKEVVILFDRGFDQAGFFHKQAADASALVKALRNGKAGFKELDEHVRALDRTSNSLSSTNKSLIATYDELQEVAENVFVNLTSAGNVDVRGSVAGFKEMAESLKYSGPLLEAITAKFEHFKKINEGKVTNIIEKWAKDLDKDSLVDFMDTHSELIGAFKDGQAAQIQASELSKKALIDKLNVLKAGLAEELKYAKGADRLAATTSYLKKETALRKTAEKVQTDASKNAAEQRVRAIKFEVDKKKKLLKTAALTAGKNELLLARKTQEINIAFAKRIADIKAGALDDGSVEEQLAEFKIGLAKRETALAKHYTKLDLLESKGLRTAEEVEAKKLKASIKFYDESYKNAVIFRDKIDKLTQKDDYTKAHKAVLKAEKDLSKAKAKFLIKYNKEVKDANKKLKKLGKDVVDENKKNDDTIVKNKKEAADKLLDIEKAYTAKRKSINEKLIKDLKALDKQLANNRKSELNALAALESSTEEKLRNVKERFLEGGDKESADKRAAEKYLQQGIALTDSALRKKDTEQLSRGVQLIQQAETIGSGLLSQRDATNFLHKSLAALKDARNVEAELKELELLAEKEKKVAEAAAKRIELKEAYDNKVQTATTAIEAIQSVEKIRHDEEIKNLKIEIELYKEKIRVAKGLLEGKPQPKKSPTSEKNIEVATEAAKQAGEIADKMFEKMDKDGTRTFGNLLAKERKTLNQIDTEIQSAKTTMYEKVSKDGVRSFSEIKTEGAKVFKDLETLSQEAKDELSDLMDGATESLENFQELYSDVGLDEGIVIATDNTELEETSSLIAEIDESEISPNMDQEAIEKTNLFKTTLDEIRTKISQPFDVIIRIIGFENLLKLQGVIRNLKDKTITITTRYVTQGKAKKGMMGGGRLPGFGGGDVHNILGESGEWMINKFAVRKYGDAFMSKLNNMTLPKFAGGGKIAAPLETGGGLSETLVVRFQAGGLEAPVKITDSSSRIAIKNMANELTKMRLIYAR